MFLTGGPAFSGTTLLAFLLNQGNILCLDEPDFHNPEQNHRAIPFLQRMFPGRVFPVRPDCELTYEQAFDQIRQCEQAIGSCNLGIKTCNQVLLGYLPLYKKNGYPAICMFRDIRDAMVNPLPPWVTEETLNDRYRMLWNLRDKFDLWVRYEDLVLKTQEVVDKISVILAHPLAAPESWDPGDVHRPMLKLDRHELLATGRISKERVGIWKRSSSRISDRTQETARLMGYE